MVQGLKTGEKVPDPKDYLQQDSWWGAGKAWGPCGKEDIGEYWTRLGIDAFGAILVPIWSSILVFCWQVWLSVWGSWYIF